MFKLTIESRGKVEYPLLNLNILLLGPKHDRRGFPEMFVRSYCKLVHTVDEADLIVFTGGDDVDPLLYGDKIHPSTCIDLKRDALEIAIFNEALEKGIPMFGVCRGFQLLHVLHGGKLYQDVNNHNDGGHDVVCGRTGKDMYVSSVHHQMVKDEVPNMKVLLSASESTRRISGMASILTGYTEDIEGAEYTDTACFGVQGHPEYQGNTEFQVWCLQQIERMVYFSPKVGLNPKGRRRMMPLDLESRIADWKAEGRRVPSPIVIV